MDLTQLLSERRSVRKYLPTPVAREQIEQLIQAAVLAPSAMNSQPWAFGVVQDAAALRDLSTRAKADLLAKLPQYPALAHYREMLENPRYDLFYGAPALVVIFAKPAGPHGEGDCCLAAENLLLAAREMGLGTCWIGFATMYLNQPEVKAELGVPAEYTAVSPLIVGYPDGTMPPRERNAPEMLFWK